MRPHSLPCHLRDMVSKQNQTELSQPCLHPGLRCRDDSSRRTGRGKGYRGVCMLCIACVQHYFIRK